MKAIVFSLFFILASISSFSQKDNFLSEKEVKTGWTLLFNGLNTEGWTTPGGKAVPAGWIVKDGCITTIKGGRGGDIITQNKYKNFILSVDFTIEPGCNSGIKYFFTKYPTGGNLGMEYQILDDQLGEDNKKANHLLGSFYDVMAPMENKKRVHPPGSWNNIQIISKGNKVEHWLNGKKILKFTRGSSPYIEAVAKSKFNKTSPSFGMVDEGHILLQEHGGQVSFKNIKIKTL